MYGWICPAVLDGSIGHFTPAGNAEVAKIIAEALKAKGMLKNGG
jgi:hypothetical protein